MFDYPKNTHIEVGYEAYDPENGYVCEIKFELRNKNTDHDLRIQIFREKDDRPDEGGIAMIKVTSIFVTAFLALMMYA